MGRHLGDPLSACGGTMARYADLSHDVVNLFLTKGEFARGLPKSAEQARAIRFAEAQKACEILQARPAFGNQVDLNSEVSNTTCKEFGHLLEAEQPDLVFTHWPVDTHMDHRAASLLVYDAWLRGGKKFALYHYEVELGRQTQNFFPTHYVDITQVESHKKAACYALPNTVESRYPLHEAMQQLRGMECGCKAAEAFIRHFQGPHEALLVGTGTRE